MTELLHEYLQNCENERQPLFVRNSKDKIISREIIKIIEDAAIKMQDKLLQEEQSGGGLSSLKNNNNFYDYDDYDDEEDLLD